MLTRAKVAKKKFLGGHAMRSTSHKDPLYGISYPPDHLRLVDFSGDPADITCGLITFDRDLGPLPGELNLWCGDKKGFGPEPVNPRVVRARFNCPIYTSSAWSWDTAGGDFTGKDGCKYALPASGLLQWAGGPHPAGKIWLTSIIRYDSTTLDFTFNQAATNTGDPSGFWCTDEYGNAQSGSSLFQPASEIIRVSFMSNIGATPMPVGLVAGFSGIVEYADLLCPVTWRI